MLPVQFLSGRSESRGQSEAFHRKTGHRSAHGERSGSSGIFFPSLDPDISITYASYVFLSFPFSRIFPLRQIKQVQDEERKQLTQLRDVLKSALQVEQKEVTHKHTEVLYDLSMSKNMSVKYHVLISYKSALKSDYV